jgi:hypothetical protein
MTDDSREAIFLANLYLYHNIDSWESPRLEKMKTLLINQKNWVESYVNQDLTYQLLSGVIKAITGFWFKPFKSRLGTVSPVDELKEVIC